MTRDTSIGSKIFDWVIIILMIMIGALSLAPILHTIAISFSGSGQAAAGNVTVYPKAPTLAAYKKLMEDHQFFLSFWVSIKRVVISAILMLFVTLLIAFPLSRETKEFRLRNIYMWLLVFIMMFNGGLVPTYMTIKSYGLLNNFWVLVLPGLVDVFSTILVINFFRNLPKQLNESAEIDGAGPWRKLIYIYIPISLPVIATITLFNIVGNWNEYLSGLIYITSNDLLPLQTYLQRVIVQIDPTQINSLDDVKNLAAVSNDTLNAAKIAATMIPIIIVYPFMQRYFIHGITLGSVKE